MDGSSILQLDTATGFTGHVAGLEATDELDLRAINYGLGTSGTYVYDKGMLVAFMLDLIARSQDDTRPLSEVYRQLFASFADKPVDGNEVIIGLLSSSKQARELCERYITGRSQLEFESFLPQFGFRVETRENRSIVIINNNLNDQQRELVRSFGLKP